MRRRSLVSIGAVVLVALIAGAWLLWPVRQGSDDVGLVPGSVETAAPLDPVVEAGTAEDAELDAPFVAPVLPMVALDTSLGDGGEPTAVERVSIIVTVRVDGQPLDRVIDVGPFSRFPVRVIATREPVGPVVDGVVAHASLLSVGEFSTLRDWFDGDPKPGRPPDCLGILEVPSLFPLYVSVLLGSAVLGTTRVDAVRGEVLIELTSQTLEDAKGGVRLRVISAESAQPIGDSGIEYGLGLLSTGKAQADPTTGLIVERMASGPVTVTVQAPGYERVLIPTRVSPGQDRNLGDVALHQAKRLAGVIQGPGGDPASDAFVWLVPVPSKIDAISLFDIQSHSSEDGRFELQQAGPRRYLLVATDFSNAAVVPVDLRQADLAELQVSMQPMTALDVILPPEPLATARLRLWTESGIPVSSWPDFATKSSSTEWTVPLVPGDYVLAINSAQHGRMTRAITVGATHARFDLAEILK